MPTPTIMTRRLGLTALSQADAPALFGYRSHPLVRRYQCWEPADVNEVELFIDGQQRVSFDTPGTWFQFGVRLSQTDTLVGDLGVGFLADEPRQVQLGITIAPDHQGRGYGAEALAAVLDHVFVSMDKHRAVASVDPRNVASVALLTKTGMRREAHHRESIWFKGEWVDDLVFAVLASEWGPGRWIPRGHDGG